MEKKSRGKGTGGKIELDYSIGIIIFVVSFILIVLIFFVNWNPRSETNKQICHDSVVFKATTKNLIGELNCRTDYVCISGGGGCRGIEPTYTIKVNLNNKEEIMMMIAEEMANCWWMFGEGKLNFIGLGEIQVLPRTKCGICSIISFDDKILAENYQITYKEFYQYLNTIEIKESETYFHYMYDSYSIGEFQEKSSFGVDIDNTPIISDDVYAVLTGYKKGIKLMEDGKFFPEPSQIIYPHYIKSDEVDSTGCRDFVTMA